MFNLSTKKRFITCPRLRNFGIPFRIRIFAACRFPISAEYQTNGKMSFDKENNHVPIKNVKLAILFSPMFYYRRVVLRISVSYRGSTS